MEPVSVVEGTACPIPHADIDTDAIIPKQFLKRVERTGFGPFAFYEWRFEADGTTPKPDFPMNKPEYQGASVLVSGPNFGCGSSREHAPWALEDAGFKAIIAPSFADIFRNNCGKIGVVAVVLSPSEVEELTALVQSDPSTTVRVDLPGQTVTASRGGEHVFSASFDIDQHTKHCLLNGLDDVGLTLANEGDITVFEAGRPGYKPRVA